MTLGEIESLMRSAAREQKNVVIVDQSGRTFRGTALFFDEWYRRDSGYASLCFEDEGECYRLDSNEILYIEFRG